MSCLHVRTQLRLTNGTGRGAQLPGRLILCSWLFVVLGARPARLAAQTTSIIQGTVTDPQGLAITGAEITLSGPVLPSGITITSDARGSYRIPGLQPGIYNLRVA